MSEGKIDNRHTVMVINDKRELCSYTVLDSLAEAEAEKSAMLDLLDATQDNHLDWYVCIVKGRLEELLV